MTDIDDLMLEASAPKISDTAAKGVSALADLALTKQGEINALNEQIKILSEEVRNIFEKDLPDAMDAIGMPSFTLKDGSSVEVIDKVHANIPEPSRAAGHKYLRDIGQGDLIKVKVETQFGKGQEKLAEQLVKLIQETFAEVKGITPKTSELVAWNTLTAWVKENSDKPDDDETKIIFTPEQKALLGIYESRLAIIKPPKAPKKK